MFEKIFLYLGMSEDKKTSKSSDTTSGKMYPTIQHESSVVEDPFITIDRSKKGIPVSLFETVVNHTGYTRQAVAEMAGLNIRTVNNYRKRGVFFEKKDAEHLLKLNTLFKKGTETFGSMSEFKRWLEEPAFGLDNRIPRSLLDTISGIDLVSRELTRIAYGDFS